jgi:hypothetical protein
MMIFATEIPNRAKRAVSTPPDSHIRNPSSHPPANA